MKLIVGLGNKKKVEIFSEICGLLKNLTEYIVFEFREEGLYSQGMSFDQISLYEFMIKKDWFEFYDYNEDDLKVITVNSNIIQKIFNTRQDNQFLTIDFRGKPDKINIMFKNKTPVKTDIPKEFEITLMDIDHEFMNIPDNEYEAEFCIPTKIFGTVVDQLEIFDEHLKIKCNEDTIEFKASGFEGSMSVNLFSDKVDYISEYAIIEDGNLDLIFSNKHFQTFCKFSKVSKEVKLSFSENMPMQMLFALDNSNDEDKLNNSSYLRFCLAPKIGDDE